MFLVWTKRLFLSQNKSLTVLSSWVGEGLPFVATSMLVLPYKASMLVKGGIAVDIMHFNIDALATTTTMMPLKDQQGCIVSPNCDASTFTRSEKQHKTFFISWLKRFCEDWANCLTGIIYLWRLAWGHCFGTHYLLRCSCLQLYKIAMLRKPFAKQIKSQQNSGRFYLVQGVMQPDP